MTKLEKNIIIAINTMVSNDIVEVKGCGLFVNKNGISQNFAVIVDDHLIVRIDHNCKGIYKKILKHHNKINKPIILGTDLISKFIINRFTEDDAEEMLDNLFQYCDTHLIKKFMDSKLSLKDLIFNTANFFDLGDEYFEIISNDRNFEIIKNLYTEYGLFNINIVYIPPEIEKEFNQLEWLANYRNKQRDSFITEILNEI